MKKFLLILIALLIITSVTYASENISIEDYKKLSLIEKIYLSKEKSTVNLDNRISSIVNDGTKQKADDRPKVAVLYINNAKSTYDTEVDMHVLPNLGQSLPQSKYQPVDGTIYLERLNKIGIVDLSTAERADIMDVFKGDDIDYAIILEIQPFLARDKITFFTIGKDITTVVPFKIIDIANNKYLYNGKFTEKASGSSMIGLIGNKSMALKALSVVKMQISSAIETRLPQTKPVKMS